MRWRGAVTVGEVKVVAERARWVAQARVAVRQAIHLYNTGRPHMSLGLATPEEVHQNTPKPTPTDATRQQGSKAPAASF